jgi:hypothetical protein
MSKGTKLPSNTPEGPKQNYRGTNGNTLHLSVVPRPGASLCPKIDRDVVGIKRGTGVRIPVPQVCTPPSTTKEVN